MVSEIFVYVRFWYTEYLEGIICMLNELHHFTSNISAKIRLSRVSIKINQELQDEIQSNDESPLLNMVAIMAAIIQLNLNGLVSNLAEQQQLIVNQKPNYICLKAVAIRIYLSEPFTICSIY